MPANDFEKQAKQLLDDLQFRPRESVWTEVEKQIKEKKRRRWFLLLPIVAGLMLGAYFFTTYHSGQSTLVKEEVFKPAPNHTTSSPGEENPITKNTTKALTSQEKNFLENQVEKKQPVNVNGKDDKITKSNDAGQLAGSVLKTTHAKNRLNTKEKSGLFIKEKESTVSSSEANNISGNNIPTITNTQEIAQVNSSDNDINLPAWEEKSVIVKETKEDNPSANTVAKLNTVVSKKKKTVKNKWQIGVTTTAGISNVTESVLSLHKARNQNYTTALSSSSAITYNYPSANYAALGLQAGLFAQLNLSARTGIQAGLNYAFYQTKITTGKPLDPATLAGNLNGFSNVRSGNAVFGNKNNYNSKLHYLELPVAFAWQINKSNRIPITWSNGLIIGQLIKADYLHYDTIARGIYYHDNTLLSKTSVALYTGIGVRLFAHSKTPLQVGPSLQWGITDLLKPSAEKKYLLYGALKMQLFLSGKKNN